MGSTDSRSDIQQRHLRWLSFLEKRTKLALTKLATEAGLSHVALTRLRKPGYDGVLSVTTIQKLTSHTGLPGPDQFEVTAAPSVTYQPGMREETEAFDTSIDDPVAKAVRALIGSRNSAHAWTMKNEALEQVGVKAGDVLIIDQAVRPRPGDVVCAQVSDRPGGTRTETVMRVYLPGWIVPASANPVSWAPAPIIEGQVVLMGTMTEKITRRAA